MRVGDGGAGDLPCLRPRAWPRPRVVELQDEGQRQREGACGREWSEWVGRLSVQGGMMRAMVLQAVGVQYGSCQLQSQTPIVNGVRPESQGTIRTNSAVRVDKLGGEELPNAGYGHRLGCGCAGEGLA